MLAQQILWGGRAISRGVARASRRYVSALRAFYLFFGTNRSSIMQTVFGLLIALSGFAAGFVLGYWSGLIESLPGMIVLVPTAIAMRGNIFGAMASRISSKLHTGELSTEFKKDALTEWFIIVMVQGTLMAVTLAFLAYGLCLILHISTISLHSMIFISTTGAFIAKIPLFMATYLVAVHSYRKGLDPDNITIPLVTAMGDFVTMPSLVAAAYILLSISVVLVEGYAIIIILGLLLMMTFARRLSGRILLESTPFLTMSAFITTISGLILMLHSSLIYLYPAILILLPPFNEETGNLGGIFASRLSSAYHMGLVEITPLPDEHVMKEFKIGLFVAILIFPLVGFLAWIISVLSGISTPPIHLTIGLSLVSGLLATLIAMTISYYTTYLAMRIDFDPDNVSVPVITSLMDLTGTVLLISLALLFLK